MLVTQCSSKVFSVLSASRGALRCNHTFQQQRAVGLINNLRVRERFVFEFLATSIKSDLAEKN
jgi:hypothetical protein